MINDLKSERIGRTDNNSLHFTSKNIIKYKKAFKTFSPERFGKNHLLLISWVSSVGVTMTPSLYTLMLPEAISSIRITSPLL